MTDLLVSDTAALPRFTGKGSENFDTHIARLENTLQMLDVAEEGRKRVLIYTLDEVAFQTAHRFDKEHVITQHPDGTFSRPKKIPAPVLPAPEQRAPRRRVKTTLRRAELPPHMQQRGGGDTPYYCVSNLQAGEAPPSQQNTDGPCPLQHQLDASPHNEVKSTPARLLVFETEVNGCTALSLFDPGSEFHLVRPPSVDKALTGRTAGHC